MNIEEISFQIIAAVGTARSHYINAINSARDGEFNKAYELIEEGKKAFTQGHNAHFDLITHEADENKEKVDINLILMHAEDQLMSAESFGILANNFIDVYKKIYEID